MANICSVGGLLVKWKKLLTPTNLCKPDSEINLVLPELTNLFSRQIRSLYYQVYERSSCSLLIFLFYWNLPLYNEAMWKQDAIITGGKRLEKQSFDICRSHDCRGLVLMLIYLAWCPYRAHWALSYRELEHLCDWT